MDYKNRIIVGLIMLALGIAGIVTDSNTPISIFLIVISLLVGLVVLTDYITEKRKS